VAFTLCVTIAHLEDAKRYTGPVNFYNEQLLAVVGISRMAITQSGERAGRSGRLVVL